MPPASTPASRLRGRRTGPRSASTRAASSRSTPAPSCCATGPARIVVAAGAVEQPLVFPGNDLVGVLLPEAVRRMVGRWSLKPGERAVVVTADEGALDTVAVLEQAGTEVVEVVDLRETRVRQIAGKARAAACLAAVELDGRESTATCSSCPAAASPPTRSSRRQARRSSTTHARGIFVPPDLPAGVEAVGAVAGESASRPCRRPATAPARGQCFVCVCEDVRRQGREARDRRGLRLDRARQALHDRDHGPLPGRALPPPLDPRSTRARAGRTRRTIGTTTARPPWPPVELGLLAGRAARAGQAHVDPPPPRGARAPR